MNLSKDQNNRIHADLGGFITVVPADFSLVEAEIEIGSLHSYALERGATVPSWASIKSELDQLKGVPA